MNIKTVRLNKEEHDTLVRARNMLIHEGISKLEPKHREKVKKEVEDQLGRFTLGLIVGVAAALLIQELSK